MHHAYLMYTKQPHARAVVSILDTIQHDEKRVMTFESFGIPDARSLITTAQLKPSIGTIKLLQISVQSITTEAEQALLKLFEDPPEGTVFVLCVPPQKKLLPTLLSRFYILPVVDEEATDETFVQFQNMSYADRIECIAKKMKSDDAVWLRAMHTGLLHHLRTDSRMLQHDRKNLAYIAETLNTRGASNKMLLEEIALTLVPDTK